MFQIIMGSIHDDNPNVRWSGMFSASQRRTAVPALLDFAQDGAIQGDTRDWIFQALRDITGQSLPHDAARWREWYAAYSRKE